MFKFKSMLVATGFLCSNCYLNNLASGLDTDLDEVSKIITTMCTTNNMKEILDVSAKLQDVTLSISIKNKECGLLFANYLTTLMTSGTDKQRCMENYKQKFQDIKDKCMSL